MFVFLKRGILPQLYIYIKPSCSLFCEALPEIEDAFTCWLGALVWSQEVGSASPELSGSAESV